MSKHFQLYQHPWFAMLAVMLSWIVCLFIFQRIVFGLFKQTPGAQSIVFTTVLLAHITLLFLIVPFVFRLPEGKRSFKAYLDAIRLSRVQPFFQILLLALSCYLIQAICQIGGVLVYRALQDLPVNWAFLHIEYHLTKLVPSGSWSWLEPFTSIFEEITFRGVVLSVFLLRYSKPKAILFSSIGFGAMHLLNLTGGKEPSWVLGQVAWSIIFGLFYGVVVLKANSLWPAMLIHYLSNLFIYPLTAYIQVNASVQTQTMYNLIFFFGFIPTTLMILWVLLFTKIWPISVRNGLPEIKGTEAAASEERIQ
jgi:membrane protease YdiL (CAAX protease family)